MRQTQHNWQHVCSRNSILHHSTSTHHTVHCVLYCHLRTCASSRQYFGDQVGFYLAYLNALTCWLVAPTVTSTFLLWALRRTGATGA